MAVNQSFGWGSGCRVSWKLVERDMSAPPSTMAAELRRRELVARPKSCATGVWSLLYSTRACQAQ